VRPWVIIAAAAAILAGGWLIGRAGEDVPPQPPPDTFYEALPVVGEATPPGQVVRSEPLGGLRADLEGTRILYRSTGVGGVPTLVSGVVIRPRTPPPPEGFPLLIWAHPTVGIADQCTPSRFGPPPGLDLDAVIAAGWAVTATDYLGLGTPEIHPYLDGPTQATAVLDSARAARSLPGTTGNAPMAIWGYSQGGHAAIFAAQLAATYAPELPVVGVVAAAAPATRNWLDDALGEPGRYPFALLAAVSRAEVDPTLRLADVLGPRGVAWASRVRGDGSATCPDIFAVLKGAGPAELTRATFSEVPSWREAMATVAVPAVPTVAPVYLQHGTNDQTVPFEESRALRRTLCSVGTSVELHLIPGGSHLDGMRSARPLGWLAERRAGRAAVSGCPASAAPR
jgi:pimeloyl-ACP methyl ester carboxylesterase